VTALGAGFSAAGFCPAGFGDIVTAPAPATDNLIDSKGIQQSARIIDPVTKDYVLNATGRVQGTTRMRQLVQLRIMTALNSSSIANFGMTQTSGDRSIVIDRRTQANLAAAVDDLVQAGMIQIVTNTVRSDLPSRDRVLFVWRDLTTGQEFPESPSQ